MRIKCYKITGFIRAKNEEMARFYATLEGGHGYLKFEVVKEMECQDEIV